MKYGYYSQKAVDAGCGSSYYIIPGGEKIEVTCVSDIKEWVEENYKWDDKVFVGMVLKWHSTAKSKFFDY